MSKDDPKQAPRKEAGSIGSEIDLDGVALQIEENRMLAADAKRLIFELEKCVAVVEAHLRERRRTLEVQVPRQS